MARVSPPTITRQLREEFGTHPIIAERKPFLRVWALGALYPPVPKTVWTATFATLCVRMINGAQRPKDFRLGEAAVVPLGGQTGDLGWVEWGMREV